MSNPYGATIGLDAAAAVEPFRFLEISSGEFSPTDAAADKPVAISVQKTASGDRCTGQVDGVCYLEVDANSANLVVGDLISPKATGAGVGVKAVTSATHAAKALQPASTDGAVILVRILDGTTVG